MESAAGKSCKNKPWAFSECNNVESVELENILTQVDVRGFRRASLRWRSFNIFDSQDRALFFHFGFRCEIMPVKNQAGKVSLPL